MSDLEFLLRSGGLSLLGLGLLLALCGGYFIVRPQYGSALMIYALATLLPATLALLAIYSACGQFTAMGKAEVSPKPAEFASVVGYAMSSGFFGILGTLLPTVMAWIAFSRAAKQQRVT